jgi:hypothetical protein
MKRFGMIFAIWAVAGGLCAHESSGIGGTITDVAVSGLQRTKPHVVTNPLRKFAGIDERALDVNDVFAVVKHIGIVEPLSAEVVDHHADFFGFFWGGGR